MINKNYTYAIVGASNNSEKYGHKVLKDLVEAKYKTIPINPKEELILGLKTYHNLSECPVKIDVVVFVVPPSLTEKILEEVLKLGIKNVWMQPGSESEKAIEFCEKNKIELIKNSCIMLSK